MVGSELRGGGAGMTIEELLFTTLVDELLVGALKTVGPAFSDWGGVGVSDSTLGLSAAVG